MKTPADWVGELPALLEKLRDDPLVKKLMALPKVKDLFIPHEREAR